MKIAYKQSTGQLIGADNKIIATGYSGFGKSKNKPADEHLKGLGPIPRGLYRIGAPYNSKNVGPFALPLEPVDHDAHGRSAFRMHGDSKRAPGTASHGCIIMSLAIRKKIVNEKIGLIYVIE